MKREWFIYLLVILLGVTLNACKGDNEVPEKPKNGMVLLGDKMIPANTEFTQEELIKCLVNNKWVGSKVYLYDTRDMSLKWQDELDQYFEFHEDGTMVWGDSMYEYYKINNRNLQFIRDNIYYTSTDGKEKFGEEEIAFRTIIAADDDLLVFDCDSICTITYCGTEKKEEVKFKTVEEQNEIYRVHLVPAK